LQREAKISNLDRCYIPRQTLFHLVCHTSEISVKIKIDEGSELKIQRKALLKGEISVVLEIRVPTLWIPEPVDDVNGGNGVRNRLLGFGFYVLSHMQVVTNRSCYAGQFLQCIALSNLSRRSCRWN